MINVEVEPWPFGEPAHARLIGSADITNDGSGNPTTGNYNAVFNIDGKEHRVRVEDYPRAEGIWKLIYQALRKIYG